MALKYWFEYTTDAKTPTGNDIVVHRCEIHKDDFVGESTQIYGSAVLTKASTEDTLESIRGGGLTINLEASSDLTFNDLYSENERVFSVKYIRNNIELFYGWLSPEGLFEDFVNDKWVISLDCTDGLGFLKNLSYVDNSGLPFSGKQSMLEVVVNCLKRTNLQQNIYSRINIVHANQPSGTNVLAQTYVNANRFLKEDRQQTIMQCDEVLRSILEPFGACITQYQGSWVIYKPNELADPPNEITGETALNFFAYDYEGIALNPAIVSLDFNQELGSRKDNFYPHHVNENQRLSVDSAIGAYRINYKYGLVASFFENIYLESSLDPNSNPIIDEWTINDINFLSFPSDNLGFLISVIPYNGLPLPETTLVLTSDSFSFLAGNEINTKISFSFLNYKNLKTFVSIKVKVILENENNTYYLNNDGSWSEEDSFVSLSVVVQIREIIITSQELPIDGDVHMEIYRPIRGSNQGDPVNNVKIYNFNFYPSSQELNDVKGENHTFQIINNPSTKIEEVKEVFNGDSPTDTYIGTLYEADQTTPTELWDRNLGITRFIPLLRIMGEERMKMYAKPLRVFSGDIYGYIDYLSVINIFRINNVKFMPIEYSYDSENNITTIKSKQILNDLIPDASYSGIDYSLTLDYGNVVEPTIKG